MIESTNIAARALELHTLRYHVVPLCGPEHACASPGKIPHGRGWNRYGESQSRTEVEQLFKRHVGNLGIVPQKHQIVIDVDPRAFKDGVDSFEELCDDLAIPSMDTPHATTGGGGDHWFFTLPEGTKLPAGGSLGMAGYPGVEWKTFGGQVVAAPSVHASGKSYLWEIELEPDMVPAMEIPANLLQLIFNVRDNIYDAPEGTIRQTKALNDGVRGAKWSKPQRLGFFADSYAEGSRRVGTGLPRLVGILGSQGVCQPCASRFMDWWQQDHFLPPIDSKEMDTAVRSMYKRWGYDGSNCDHGQKGFLRDVTAVSMGNPKSPEVQQAAAEVIEQAAIEEDKATRRARSLEQNKALYEARGRFVSATSSGRDAEFPPLQLTVGGKLCVSGTESPLLMTDPSAYMPKEVIEDFLRVLEGDDSKRAQSICECGWVMTLNCSSHGERIKTRRTCNQAVHAHCPSSLGLKVRQVELDDMEDGGQYREVWLWSRLATPGLTYGADQKSIEAATKKFTEVIGKVSRRKTHAGKVLHRAISYYLARPHSVVFFKFMVREEVAGECDSLIDEVIAGLHGGALNQAQFLADKTFTSGMLAVTQLYEDSMTNLVGMADEGAIELFHAWFLAMKGAKWFQGMSVLWQKLKEVKADEPARCDICQERLIAIAIDPALEEARRAAEAENGGYLSGLAPMAGAAD